MIKTNNAIGRRMYEALCTIGLERRRPLLARILPAVGILFAGAAVGAGCGLMLAPSSGRRFRQGMGHRIGHLRRRVKAEAQRGANAVASAIHA